VHTVWVNSRIEKPRKIAVEPLSFLLPFSACEGRRQVKDSVGGYKARPNPTIQAWTRNAANDLIVRSRCSTAATSPPAFRNRGPGGDFCATRARVDTPSLPRTLPSVGEILQYAPRSKGDEIGSLRGCRMQPAAQSHALSAPSIRHVTAQHVSRPVWRVDAS
jgi:hypothetical protein